MKIIRIIVTFTVMSFITAFSTPALSLQGYTSGFVNGSYQLTAQQQASTNSTLISRPLTPTLAAAETKTSAVEPLSDPNGDWTLLSRYSDEFNGASLDTSKWNKNIASWSDYWSWRPENVSVHNGHAILRMQYDPHTRNGKTVSYTSGIIQSTAPPLLHGYFEARIKGVSRFPGVCPAFWLNHKSADGRWTEIDIIEMQETPHNPSMLDFTTHTWRVKGVAGLPIHRHNHLSPNWNPADNYHVYGLEWDAENIRWYVDGRLVALQPNTYFNQPLDVILSLGLRDPLKATASSIGFPTEMKVDYVRVWSGKSSGHALQPARMHADLNGDGTDDLVLQRPDGQVSVWLMKGTTINRHNVVPFSTNLPSSAWRTLQLRAIGDLNGDGQYDLIWQRDNGQILVWYMHGIERSGGGEIASPGAEYKLIGSGDFNGDGKDDLVLRSNDGRTIVWLMDGNTVINKADIPFSKDVTSSFWRTFHLRALGDLNGDGKTDFVWQKDDGQILVWYMYGIQRSGGGDIANPGTAYKLIGTGDFNGDRKDDLVLRSNDGRIIVWLMDGTSVIKQADIPFSKNVSSQFWPTFHIRAIGDLNGDGKDDIVWQRDNGEVLVWYMDGTSHSGGGVIDKTDNTVVNVELMSQHSR